MNPPLASLPEWDRERGGFGGPERLRQRRSVSRLFRLRPGLNQTFMNPDYIDVRFLTETPADTLPGEFGIITACNPNGRTVAAKENAQATESLRIALNEENLIFFPVTGGSSDFTHTEPGFGVLFASREEAISWGRRYRQEAIFWIANGTVSPITSKCTTCDHFKVHHPGRVIF